MAATNCRRLAVVVFVLSMVSQSFAQPEVTVKPTSILLNWQNQSTGAFITFGMASAAYNCSGNGFCIGVGGCVNWVPPVDTFNPFDLNTDQWLQAAVSFGAKYAVLVTQHCSGFSLFPTEAYVYEKTGFVYDYSVEHTKWGNGRRDIVAEFIASCKKYGVKPGFYYSLNENLKLNVGHGKVQNTTLLPGQVRVSQELYESIAVAQQELLWSKYGDLFELWFDGGEWPKLVSLANKLQPSAVQFNGLDAGKSARWIGTESGTPSYPIWSTNTQVGKAGSGSATGKFFNPAESDTTPTVHDHWFWRPENARRSLADMKAVYHHTVGQNSNLLLNIAPNNNGVVDDGDVALYKQMGDFIRGCYGATPLASAAGTGSTFTLTFKSKSTAVDRFVIAEDLSVGQVVRQYTIEDGSSSKVLANGTSVGNKRIQLLSSVVSLSSAVLRVQPAAKVMVNAFYCGQ